MGTLAISVATVPTDEEDQVVTYSLSPASLEFADLSLVGGVLTITALEHQHGTAEVVITAIDDGQTASTPDNPLDDENSYSQILNLTIHPINDAPIFSLVSETAVDNQDGSYDLELEEDFLVAETLAISVATMPTDEEDQVV